MPRTRAGVRRWRAHGGTLLILGAVLSAALAGADGTPRRGGTPARTAKAGQVTSANVAARVLGARTTADHEALAAYYKAQAAAEEPRIAYFDQLFRAYMQLEGKQVEPEQRHARTLLKGARMVKQHYELLAQAHLNLAWENKD